MQKNPSRCNLLKGSRSILIIFFILLLDQLFKFWVKTNMLLGEEFNVAGDWFKIHFTENEGMAFGLKFGGVNGKLILTIGRMIAIVFISVYLVKLIRKGGHYILIISISFILGGAIGNIIDSLFYGVLFSDSTHSVAEFLSANGYGSIFYGKVVDMLYFPLIRGFLPEWLPIWGGEYFIFFRPVFNIADTAITIGVILVILFQKKIFANKELKKSTSKI